MSLLGTFDIVIVPSVFEALLSFVLFGSRGGLADLRPEGRIDEGTRGGERWEQQV
jgi:hypothetical protein